MTDDGDLIGKTLGKCKIRGKLGYGKTATIFRAFYAPLEKEVAVKILKKDANATEELREKFLNEAKSLARLDHENIVKVFDVVEEGEYLFIIMELLKGRDLWQIMKQNGPFEPDQAIDIMIGTAKALKAAHAEGIIHRDIKPQNIMLVGRRDRVKLVDFGLAAEGAVVGKAGTPFYMSPEQIQGKRVEAKSDIYSAGATFFHILTGKPPYPGKTRKDIFEKVLGGQIPTASRANKDLHLPKAVDPVVKRMMAPVAGYRYSAKDLSEALDNLNLAAGGKQRHRHAARAAVKRNKGTPKVLIGAAIGIVVIAAVLVVVLVMQKDAPPPPPPDQQAGAQHSTTAKQPSDYGIGDRSQNIEARKQRAWNAYQAVQKLEGKDPNDYATLIEAYRNIWENEDFGGTVYDEKARERMKQLEAARDQDKHRAEELAKKKKRDEAMVEFRKELDKMLTAYQFPAARQKIHDFMFEHGETKELAVSSRRLEHSVRCIEALIEAVNSNDRKMNLAAFMDKAPDDAVLQSMDNSGITVRTGTTDRVEVWTYLKPVELKRLISKQSWSRDPLKLFFAYCLFRELKFDRDAESMLMNAELRDRTGQIQQLKAELGE